MLSFLLFFSLQSSAHSAEPAKCNLPFKLTERQLNPTQLRAILTQYNQSIQSPGDFLCCLPDSYQIENIVGHSSEAGQPGQPDSPRVLFFNKETRKVFSISGGVEGQANGKNVEFFIDNPQTGDSEYYDIPCDEKRGCKVSRANPTQCMSCHGNGFSPFSTGGKPLFEFGPRQWPAFNDGNAVSPWCTDMFPEAELARLAKERANRALLSGEHSNFRCAKDALSKPSEAFQRPSISRLTDMGDMVVEINGRRFIEEMQQNKNYEKYKYLWTAERLGCFLKEKSFDHKAILDWVDASDYPNWKNDRYIVPRRGNDPMSVCKEAVNKIDKGRAKIHKTITEQLALARQGKKFKFVMDRSIRACSGNQTPEEFCKYIMKTYGFKEGRWDLFERFKMDTILASPRREMIEGGNTEGGEVSRWITRFIFEANGSDQFSRWSTSRMANEYTRIGRSPSALAKLLDRDRSLRALNINARLKNRDQTEKIKICDELKSLSQQASQVFLDEESESVNF